MSSKEIQEALNKEKRMLITIRRDAEQEEIVKKHKKKHKRDESLLEIHEKKLKKKKVNIDLNGFCLGREPNLPRSIFTVTNSSPSLTI